MLTGRGAEIDTTTSVGRMIFGIFATLAEFERDLMRERTMAGLAAARARGRKGGSKFSLTKARARLVQAAMAKRDTSVSALAAELGVKPVTLYRYVDVNGNLRDHGKRVLWDLTLWGSRPQIRLRTRAESLYPCLRSVRPVRHTEHPSHRE